MSRCLERLRAALNALGLLVRDLLRPTNLLAVVVLLALAYMGVTYLMARYRSARVARERAELEAAVADLAAKNAALRADVRRLEAQCEELRGFVRRLSAESRVAEARVVAHRADPQGEPTWTIEFAEHDPDGNRLPARTIVVRGKEVYFDALIIKFDRDLVKVGDPLRGRTLHVFRRAFGSAQEPREGPLLAGAATPSAFEQGLWLRFWHWADHPRAAEAEGVRVAQVEAVAIRPLPDALYRLTIEHAGGLNVKLVEPGEP